MYLFTAITLHPLQQLTLLLLQSSLQVGGETSLTVDPDVVDLFASAQTALLLPMDAFDDTDSVVDVPALQLQRRPSLQTDAAVLLQALVDIPLSDPLLGNRDIVRHHIHIVIC